MSMNLNLCKKQIKENYKIIIPLLVFFIGFSIFNIVMKNTSDDIGFKNIIDSMGGYNWNNLITAMKDRYLNWTSRTLINFYEFTFVRVPVLFRFLNIFITIVPLCFVFKHITKNKSLILNLIVSIVFLGITIGMSIEAGITASAVNVMWPLSATTLSIYICIKTMLNKKINIWWFILSIFLLLISGLWSESIAGPIVFFYLFVVIYSIVFNKKINVYSICYSLLTILFLIHIFRCPGNFNRLKVELTNRGVYDSFMNLTFFDKLSRAIVWGFMGLCTTIPLVIMTSIILFKKSKNILFKISALTPYAFVLIFAICLLIYREDFFNKITYVHRGINPLITISMFFGIMNVLLNLILIDYKNLKRCFVILIVFATVMASYMMLGFGLNPGTRNLAYGFYILLPLTYFYIVNYKNYIKEKF